MTELLPHVSRVSPFAILGLAPTLDLGQVKRAWFRALPRFPPHQDPEGFQRLRAAYEALTRPGGLAVAYAASPIDVAAARQQWLDRFEARLASATAAAHRSESDAAAITRFVEATSRMTLAEALAATPRPG